MKMEINENENEHGHCFQIRSPLFLSESLLFATIRQWMTIASSAGNSVSSQLCFPVQGSTFLPFLRAFIFTFGAYPYFFFSLYI